jgi:hypothetical protein
MSLADYAGYVAQRHPVVWIDGLPWRIKNRILEPIAPPHLIGEVSRPAVVQALRRSGALLARWNEGWDTARCAWWWVCCDLPDYGIERLPRRGRRGLRQGLARCAVRRLDAAELAAQGYPVYRAAHERYPGDVRPAAEAAFVAEIRRAGESGLYESWGALVDGRLAAYARCIRLDDVVIMSEVKSDPALLPARPNHALIASLTGHYLQAGCRYVTDGSRSVRHETRFQAFLEELGYRRIYCPLRVAMTPLLAAAVGARCAELGRRLGLGRLLPGFARNLEAVATLAAIARSCGRPLPAGGDGGP